MKQKLLLLGAFFAYFGGISAADGITVTPATGTDIAAAVTEAKAGAESVGDITINLAENGNYTISASIETAAGLVINGNGATIDAKDLTAPLVLMSATPAVEAAENGFSTVGDVKFINVNVTGLTQQLIYGNKVKYYIPTLVTDGCQIQLGGGNKTVYDFNGGGVVGTFDINNSTINSTPANTGALYSSQSGQKVTDVASDLIQTFSIKNSTLYNIAYTKNVCAHRQNSQKWLTYIVKNNVIINCGKQGQFVMGLNGGGRSANPTFEVDNNSFIWETGGVFAVQAETEPAADVIQNSVGEPTTQFTQAAEGIFTLHAGSAQAKAQVGAPKWLVAYDAAVALPAPVVVAPATGEDITAAVAAAKETVDKVGNITINLAENGEYTVSGSIEIPAGLVINGNGATIDAKDLTAPLVLMSATPAVEAAENGFSTVGDVKFINVNVTGLTQQLIYGNKVKYYIPTLVTDGCQIQLAGGSKTVYDFNGGGVVGTFDINNSTINSTPANTGALYSSQSGQKVTDVASDLIQTFSIKNSTLYNIAYTKNVCAHRQNSQKWLTYIVKNNVIINCGKQGQFVLGLNGGGNSTNPTFEVDKNSFIWETDGVFAVQAESEPSEGLFKNTVGEPTTQFTQAAEGIFTLDAKSAQAQAQVGAPKWLVAYDDTTVGIEAVDADDAAAPVEYFNLQGVRVDNPANGIFIRKQGSKVTKVIVK